MRSSDCDKSFLEENLSMQVFVEGLGETSEDKIDSSLAQRALLPVHFIDECPVEIDARVLAAKSSDGGRDYSGHAGKITSDPQFAFGRIDQERDVLHALAQIIEHSRSTVEQC